MPESSGTDLKIIGIPKVEDNKVPDQYLRPQVWVSIDEEEKKKKKGINFALLNPEEQQTFGLIETSAGNLIQAKLGRLRIEAPAIDPVMYATNPKNDKAEGYYDPLVGAVVYVNRPVETFDKYSTIAHALSHLATKNQVRQYLSPQDSDVPNRTWVSGAEVVGNKKPLAGALEEGMVTMDQVDFFNFYLQINHPEEYARRRQAVVSPDIQKQVSESMNKRLYGEISPLTIAPFIVFEVHKRRVRGAKSQPTLDVIGLKRYLFARKMCEVLGKSLVPDEIIGQDKAIQLGRDKIDKDRYLRTGDAHRKIVAAMGGGLVVTDRKVASKDIHGGDLGRIGQQMIAQGGLRAKTIFAAEANDPKSIDGAMAMFRYVSTRVKPVVDLNAPPAPNLSKVWAEATPVKSIKPDQQKVKKPYLASQGEALQAQAPVRSAQVESAPPTPADVIEGMVSPLAPPAPEVQAPTPRVEAPKIIPQPTEADPNSGLRIQLSHARSELEDKLDRIRRIHKGLYIGNPALEEGLADKFRADIERIEAEIAANESSG